MQKRNYALYTPWDAVLAPDNFGWASQQLLIGEVDSGNISVFNPITGEFLGELTDSHGNPLVIDGVWTLIFTRAEEDDESPRLFFAAGCAFPPNYSPSAFGAISARDRDEDESEDDNWPGLRSRTWVRTPPIISDR